MFWIKYWEVTTLGAVQGNTVACHLRELHTRQTKGSFKKTQTQTTCRHTAGKVGWHLQAAVGATSATVTVGTEEGSIPGIQHSPHTYHHGPSEQLPQRLCLYGYWHWQTAKQAVICLRTWAQSDTWKTSTENHRIQQGLESITYQHYREEGENPAFLWSGVSAY